MTCPSTAGDVWKMGRCDSDDTAKSWIIFFARSGLGGGGREGGATESITGGHSNLEKGEKTRAARKSLL